MRRSRIALARVRDDASGRLKPPSRASPSPARRPSRARASAPRGRRSRPSRRTRCAGPAARRDRRRCRRPTPSFSSTAGDALGERRLRRRRPVRDHVGIDDRRGRRGVGARRRVLGEEWRSRACCADPVARSTSALASARAISASRPPMRLRPFERVDVVLDAQHRRRVDGLALEDALDELAALGHAEDLRQRPGRRVALQPLDGARATGSACRARASPPSTFCQEKVTTSSLAKSSRCAKAAEVASQIVRPSRSAAIQSPFGTRTPEVVPFQVKTTSCVEVDRRRGRRARRRRP